MLVRVHVLIKVDEHWLSSFTVDSVVGTTKIGVTDITCVTRIVVWVLARSLRRKGAFHTLVSLSDRCWYSCVRYYQSWCPHPCAVDCSCWAEVVDLGRASGIEIAIMLARAILSRADCVAIDQASIFTKVAHVIICAFTKTMLATSVRTTIDIRAHVNITTVPGKSVVALTGSVGTNTLPVAVVNQVTGINLAVVT